MASFFNCRGQLFYCIQRSDNRSSRVGYCFILIYISSVGGRWPHERRYYSIFFRRSFSATTGFAHYLIMGSGFLSSFFLLGDTTISQSILGTSSSGSGLFRHSTHWSTLWISDPSYSGFNQSSSQSHSKLITSLLCIPYNVLQRPIQRYTYSCYHCY